MPIAPNAAHPDHDPALEALCLLSAVPAPVSTIAGDLGLSMIAAAKLMRELVGRGFRVEKSFIKHGGKQKTCVWLHANGVTNATAACEAYLSRVGE